MAPQDDSFLFYGSMRFNVDRSHPLFRTMPAVLHAGSLMRSEPAIMPLLDALAAEMSSQRVGAAAWRRGWPTSGRPDHPLLDGA